METTRHFVATVYVVHQGATALHFHDRLEQWLPPGGHVERDELPHVTAKREVNEELGLAVDLQTDPQQFETSTVESLPQAEHLLLEDINVDWDGRVGHQHIDFVYFGQVANREINPGANEQPAADWRWVRADDLDRLDLEPDVMSIARQAIEAMS